MLVFFGCKTLQNATADAETRTISFHHVHTKEDLTVTYKRNGRYDDAALKQINHLMRDWREQEPINMDPHVIDLLWEVHREVGGKEPIWVICGYRSADTNEKLRRRSSGVAKFSQHMNGKAIDFFIPGVPLEQIREAGLRAQRGGVGVYPSSGFVHMDTGSVRHWPRMPEAQLARVMSKGQLASRSASDDGRTVAVAQAGPSRVPSFLAKLFGGGKDAEEHWEPEAAPVAAGAATRTAVAAAPEKAPDKLAAKPAEKSIPVPPARPARSGTFQVASAASTPVAKPAMLPATFQVASAESKIVAVKPESVAAAKPAQDAGGAEPAAAASKPARPAQAASLVARAGMSANDIINERGYWQGLPSMEPAEAAKTGAPRPAPAPRRAVASADPATTASIAPWPLADRNDNEPPANALAYAAQPAPITPARALPMGSGSPRAAPVGSGETVAVKRSDDAPAVATPRPKGTNVARVGDRFDDPWMRAMIVSPNVQGFMKVTLFGAPDFRSLGPHLHKPASTVIMTFSQDPHLGMSSEKFDGSAVVFVSTVTFKPARTAALR